MTEVPVRVDPPKRGRWCEKHSRSECVHPPKNPTPDGLCHGIEVEATGACRMHVGKAMVQVRAEAVAQKTLLQAASAMGPVHPAETLLEANRIATIVMRRAAELVEAGSLAPAQLDVLGEWMDRAQRIAKATADADAADRWVRAQESVASRDADTVQAVFADALGRLSPPLSWDDPVVRGAFVAAIDAVKGTNEGSRS